MSNYGDLAAEPAHAPGVGICGHTPGEFDVQISASMFADPSPGSNLSASCGRTLRASRAGNSNTFTVYDKCKCTGLRQPWYRN